MHDVVYPAKLHEKAKTFIGDSHGLEQLIEAYWAFEELDEQLGREFESDTQGTFKGFSDLDHDTINAAKTWLSDESR